MDKTLNMKTIFKLLILFMLFASATIAQSGNNEGANKFGYGIKAGAIYGRTLISSDEFNYDVSSGLSYTAGAYCWMKVSRLLSIQPELSFSQLAFRINNINYTDSVGSNLGMLTTKMRLNYLQLPIILKVTIPKTGLSIMPGLQLGYLTSSKVKVDRYDAYNNNEAFKKIDLGLVFGLQYHFTNRIEIAARKTIGILNIAKNSPGTIALPLASYITVGYQL